MLVYTSQNQPLEDLDVVLVKKSYGTFPYIVWYMMATTSFVLYPLGWHSLGKEHIFILDDVETDWEYLGHIFDEWVYSQLHIAWPYDTFKQNLEFYLSNAK